MFNRKLRQENTELRKALEAAIAANETLSKRAFIIGIEREQRVNKFTFVRNGEIHQIETMGLISDDLPGWKGKLL